MKSARETQADDLHEWFRCGSCVTAPYLPADIWMGDSSYRKAQGAGSLTIVGDPQLTRNITSWMANSIFADLPPASAI